VPRGAERRLGGAYAGADVVFGVSLTAAKGWAVGKLALTPLI